MNRWTHKETDDYHIEFERFNEDLFIHVSINNWNHRVYKELIDEWLFIQEIFRDSDEKVIYGLLPEDNWEFALLFGMSVSNKFVVKNGYTLVSKRI